jgi:hypothetical protein
VDAARSSAGVFDEDCLSTAPTIPPGFVNSLFWECALKSRNEVIVGSEQFV